MLPGSLPEIHKKKNNVKLFKFTNVLKSKGNRGANYKKKLKIHSVNGYFSLERFI